MRTWAIDLCQSVPHIAGDGCAIAVEAKLPTCSGPFFAHTTDPRGFSECLGFIVPPEPVVTSVVACNAAQLASGFTFALHVARSQPWDDAENKRRKINGATLFEATTPTLTQADLVSARLVDTDGARSLVVTLSGEAGQRLEVDTTLVRDVVVVTINNRVMAINVLEPLGGPDLTFIADGLQAADVCAAVAPSPSQPSSPVPGEEGAGGPSR